ncbi:MAG: hypothetical protein QOF21_3072 [Actinomycetota bacterium]
MARWWADMLGWTKEPSNEAFIRQMVEQGHASDDDTATFEGALVWKSGAAVVRPDGLSPRLLFQLVPEPKTVKNRVHLDIRIGTDDVDELVERLVERGASVLHHGQQGPVNTWITVADPEGNEFCVSQSPPG